MKTRIENLLVLLIITLGPFMMGLAIVEFLHLMTDYLP